MEFEIDELVATRRRESAGVRQEMQSGTPLTFLRAVVMLVGRDVGGRMNTLCNALCS